MDHNDDEVLADMDDDDNNEEEEDVNHQLAQRWTCDACGCNTNHVTSDRNCTICGTSNTSSQQQQQHMSRFGTHFHTGT